MAIAPLTSIPLSTITFPERDAKKQPQSETPRQFQPRDPRAEATPLRLSSRGSATPPVRPRDAVPLSLAAASNTNATTRGRAASRGSETPRTPVAPATGSTRTPTDTSAATAPAAVSAKQVLATYDALLQSAMGTTVRLPADMSHAERVEKTAAAMKSLSPAQKTAFLQQAESIGRSLGLNFGLNKTDAAGNQVPLNAGIAARLTGRAAAEYQTIASGLRESTPATSASSSQATGTDGTPAATQAAQTNAAAWASKVDANGDGSITTEEVAAQTNTPALAEVWKKISPDGKAISTDKFAADLAAMFSRRTTPTAAAPTNTSTTPDPTPTTPADATTALPDAQTFKALDLRAVGLALGNMDGKTVAALVDRWAQGGETVSKAQLEDANPAMAAYLGTAYFRDGKDTVSVATLKQDLTKQSNDRVTTQPATPATPTAPEQS